MWKEQGTTIQEQQSSLYSERITCRNPIKRGDGRSRCMGTAADLIHSARGYFSMDISCHIDGSVFFIFNGVQQPSWHPSSICLLTDSVLAFLFIQMTWFMLPPYYLNGFNTLCCFPIWFIGADLSSKLKLSFDACLLLKYIFQNMHMLHHFRFSSI